jgi:4-amino-4-deoxy-L-arabinose transferase-like glycosyltransferase
VSGEPGLNGYHPLSASTYYYVGYTYFIAAVYAIFGHDLWALRVTQAVVGALTVWVVYLLGSLVFGRRPGLVGAALTAVYLPLVYYEGLILTETWFTFVQAVAVTLWLRAWVRGAGSGLATALVAGGVGGLTCLVRPVFLIGLGSLAAGGWFFPPVPTAGRVRAARVAAFLIGAAVAIAPVTVRNYQIHGRFFLISTNGPSTFLTGHVTHNTDLPADVSPGLSDAVLSDQHRARSWRYLERHWREYLAEIPEFFEVIWTENYFWPYTSTFWVPDRPPGEARLDIQGHMKGSPPFGRFTYFPDLVRYVDRLVWCLIGLPMGILAVLFLPRADRRWAVIYLTLLPYLAIPFLASPFSRYRLPATPLIFLLAGQSLTACWECRQWRRRESPEACAPPTVRGERPKTEAGAHPECQVTPGVTAAGSGQGAVAS